MFAEVNERVKKSVIVLLTMNNLKKRHYCYKICILTVVSLFF